MNINSRIVFISNVFTWLRWKSLIQPSLTAESYGVTWEIATSGRSMEWEKKNVSRWIFFEIGRWWCVDWESRSSKSGGERILRKSILKILHYRDIRVFWPEIPLNLTSEGLKLGFGPKVKFWTVFYVQFTLPLDFKRKELEILAHFTTWHFLISQLPFSQSRSFLRDSSKENRVGSPSQLISRY